MGCPGAVEVSNSTYIHTSEARRRSLHILSNLADVDSSRWLPTLELSVAAQQQATKELAQHVKSSNACNIESSNVRNIANVPTCTARGQHATVPRFPLRGWPLRRLRGAKAFLDPLTQPGPSGKAAAVLRGITRYYALGRGITRWGAVLRGGARWGAVGRGIYTRWGAVLL